MSFTHYWLDFDDGILYKFWAEFIGCMMFHFIGSVSGSAWGNGLALIVLIYFTAKVSGSHLNPSVSTTFMLLGHINPAELLIYWCAQIIGCIVGSLWIAALVPQLIIGKTVDASLLPLSGCFIPQDDLSSAQIFGWEALCTFCFITPIFAVVWYTQLKSGYGNTGPFIIGCSLIANALVAGPYTGGALNPARLLASPIVFKCPRDNSIPFYILGEMTAGITAPLFIIPWYGIYYKSWYLKYFPMLSQRIQEVQRQLKKQFNDSPKVFSTQTSANREVLHELANIVMRIDSLENKNFPKLAQTAKDRTKKAVVEMSAIRNLYSSTSPPSISDSMALEPLPNSPFPHTQKPQEYFRRSEEKSQPRKSTESNFSLQIELAQNPI